MKLENDNYEWVRMKIPYPLIARLKEFASECNLSVNEFLLRYISTFIDEFNENIPLFLTIIKG